MENRFRGNLAGPSGFLGNFGTESVARWCLFVLLLRMDAPQERPIAAGLHVLTYDLLGLLLPRSGCPFCLEMDRLRRESKIDLQFRRQAHDVEENFVPFRKRSEERRVG